MNERRMKFPRHEGNVFKRDLAGVREQFPDWDAIRDTPNCLHCHGTGIAPGDGRTECGFCEDYEQTRLDIERGLD